MVQKKQLNHRKVVRSGEYTTRDVLSNQQDIFSRTKARKVIKDSNNRLFSPLLSGKCCHSLDTNTKRFKKTPVAGRAVAMQLVFTKSVF